MFVVISCRCKWYRTGIGLLRGKSVLNQAYLLHIFDFLISDVDDPSSLNVLLEAASDEVDCEELDSLPESIGIFLC